MAQFVLEICRGGSWESVSEGSLIQPQTASDVLRMTLNKTVVGSCVVSIKNGPKMRHPIIGTAGAAQINLGTASEFVPGSFSIYLGQGGFESESIKYEMAAPEGGTDSGGDTTGGGSGTCTKCEIPPVIKEGDDELRRQLEEKETELRGLKEQLAALQTEKEALQEANQKLQEGTGILAGLIAEKGDIDRAIEDQKELNLRADEKRKSLLGEYNQLKFDIDDNQTSVNDRKKKLEDLEAQLKDLQTQSENKQGELEKKNTELETAQTELKKTEEELTRLQGAHTNAEQALQELISKRAALGMKDQEIADAEAQLEEKQKRLEDLQTENGELAETITSQEKELVDQQTRHDVLDEDLKKRKERLAEKEIEVNSSKERLRKLEGEYNQNLALISERLNTFYRECGLIDKQSDDINESMAIVEKAAEDPEFVSCVDDIHGLEERMKDIRDNLTKVMNIYRDTLKKLEKQQV